MPNAPIIEPYRTIRLSLCAVCEWHLPSAVLLDYLVTVEHALDEARAQGERFGPWRDISATFGALVMVYRPTPKTVMVALKRLQALGFVEAHPENSSNRGGYARNYRNRFRLCSAQVQAAVRQWHALQYDTASPDAMQNDRAVPSNFTGHSSVNLHGTALSIYRQDSVVDQDSDIDIDKAHTGVRVPSPNARIVQLLTEYLGRTATPIEIVRTANLVQQHGVEHVRTAFELATAQGGRSVKYVETIANDPGPRPTNMLPVEDDAPAPRRVSAEDAARLLRVGGKGGAS